MVNVSRSSTGHVINAKSWSQTHYLLLLTGIWLCFLGFLFILQVAHTNNGLRNPLYGEDRYWYWHLLRPTIANISTARSFWQLESRNPLSPLWYIVAGPFILNDPEYAFPIFRHLINLLGAISIFLLVDTLARQSQRFFAFACALFALFWNNFGLNVSWNLIAVTALQVLSLWLYCLYLDSDRRKGRLLALSIVIYFFAIGTYLLVAFSFVAVGVLAVFRPLSRPQNLWGWVRRVFSGLLDMSFYAIVLMLFLGLWQTVTLFPELNGLLNLDLLGKQLPLSLNAMFINDLTTTMPIAIGIFTNKMSAISVLGLFLAFVTFLGLILWLVKRVDVRNTDPSDTGKPTVTLSSTIAYVLVIVGALILYIVVLESVSTSWGPGTRTFIVGQIIQSLTYMTLFIGITSLFKRRFPRIVAWFQIAGIAVACSLALFYHLGVQQSHIVFGNTEQVFLDKLVNDLPVSSLQTKPTEIVAILSPSIPADDFASSFARNIDFVHNYYVQGAYQRGDISLHFIMSNQVPLNPSNLELVLGTDDQGVNMVSYVPPFGFGNSAWVPYQNVIFVRYDGQNWTKVEQLSREDLADFTVRFERDTPARSLYDAP